MSECGCRSSLTETQAQRRVLWIALILNATMFVVEGGAGVLAKSTGLVADAFDMLTDASVYAIALAAIGRTTSFKARAATLSGGLLLLVALGIIADVARRALGSSEPEGSWMVAVSFVALAVNIYVFRLLASERNGEVHMRAAWIFTRADVIANAAVIVAGLATVVTRLSYFDLAVGAGIGIYVAKEALEILHEARDARASA